MSILLAAVPPNVVCGEGFARRPKDVRGILTRMDEAVPRGC
ncbi:hypothetical protein [Actinomadura meyerae]|nr:hypothetical protein [Actinomadura meyerae]